MCVHAGGGGGGGGWYAYLAVSVVSLLRVGPLELSIVSRATRVLLSTLKRGR